MLRPNASAREIPSIEQGQVYLINDELCTMLGISRAEALGRSYAELLPVLEGEDYDALRAGAPRGRVFISETKTFDGREIWTRRHPTLIEDDAGNVLGMIALVEDITHQKQVEEQLRQAQKMEAIGQLVGGLAHDFNNLLGIVIGNLDMIGENLPDDPRMKRWHAAAVEGSLRGADLTRSLLAVGRRQALLVQRQELNALVQNTLPLLESSAGRDVTLGAQFCEEALMVRVDTTGLSTSLLNLAINARDAMQPQGGERWLDLRTRRVAGADVGLKAQAYAVVEVSDNGPGMSEEVKQRAFEPFFTTKEFGRGTGLGLPTVLGFTEQLGGTGRIRSEPGKGTTISIYLPIDETPEPDNALPA